ncbi:MAG TPA: N,N-dimethylformamidase beta subunit family domain-containing protein [Gaiellaceae bacterium]|nr:N,N-dimethylformamidase beta subunit family domain-containing protein [Gaiellaceae bacterium]
MPAGARIAVLVAPLALAAGLGGAAQGSAPAAVQAAFALRSYAPGDPATLRFDGSAAGVRVAIFRAGWGRDGVLQGARVTAERTVAARGPLRLRLGTWPSGLYYARVVTPGLGTWDAPFVLRPARLGANRIAIVLPTNTWQAYNDEGGDSWYFDSSVTHVDLARPYLDAGVPPHYRGYDRGFVRWLALNHVAADFLSDDDLDALDGEQLARAYDLVVFSGHDEYVTGREFDTTERYRDLGGNLAFLSANDFFYKVEKRGSTMTGRRRWRDLGRPEAALVGEQYVDWNHDRYPNRPFRVTGARRAPWLFAGTGLSDGSAFGVYGIEVDAVAPSSPPGTEVLARIAGIFGPGVSAEMTYYSTPRGAKVFSAGVMNFGGSSLWPPVRTMVANLIRHLSEP